MERALHNLQPLPGYYLNCFISAIHKETDERDYQLNRLTRTSFQFIFNNDLIHLRCFLIHFQFWNNLAPSTVFRQTDVTNSKALGNNQFRHFLYPLPVYLPDKHTTLYFIINNISFSTNLLGGVNFDEMRAFFYHNLNFTNFRCRQMLIVKYSVIRYYVYVQWRHSPPFIICINMKPQVCSCRFCTIRDDNTVILPFKKNKCCFVS